MFFKYPLAPVQRIGHKNTRLHVGDSEETVVIIQVSSADSSPYVCAQGFQEAIDLDAVGENSDRIYGWMDTWLSGKDTSEDSIHVWG